MTTNMRIRQWVQALRNALEPSLNVHRCCWPRLSIDDAIIRWEACRRRLGEQGVPTDDVEAVLRELRGLSWRNILEREWRDDHISLTWAVYWIAAGGRPIACDEEAYEPAALPLIQAAREARIAISGVKCGEAVLSAIKPFKFQSAPFFCDLPDHILFFHGTESESQPSPMVLWMPDPDEDWSAGDGDTISDGAKVYFRRLCVKKSDMQALWPAPEPAVDTAPISPAAVVTRRQRGRPGGAAKRVMEAMRRDLQSGYDLPAAKEIEMEARYRASRDICRKARGKILSENSPR
jgi:hypothetical protein